MRRLVILAVGLFAAASCQDAARSVGPDAVPAADDLANAGAMATHAVVEFGRGDVGSPFHPATGHDASGHAKDKLYPRTVVIAAGGTVTFRRGPVHAVAVYEPGVEPEDIDTSLLDPPLVPGLPPMIDDPGGRLAAEPVNAGNIFSPAEWSYTFETPGRYLVICAVLPHFAFSNMYGWVIVQ